MKKSMERNLNNVYEYIKDFRAKYGYPPSIREIKNSLNIKSTSSVHLYLQKLNKQGLISIKGKNKSRAIDLPSNIYLHPDMFCCLKEIKKISELKEYDMTKHDYMISKTLFTSISEGLFLYEMKFNDMIDAKIFKNDKLIIKKQDFAENGDIIICSINGNYAIKRYLKNNNIIILKAENNKIEDIFVNNIKIYGIVIGLIRNNI